MADIGADFLTEHRQLFPRGMGELLALFARRKYQRDTAKHVEQVWGVDPSTAANLVKGHASERTITKALRAEGWPLVMALGEAMTGQAYEEHLQNIIQETERARERMESRHRRLRDLEEQAARLVAVEARLDS